MRHKVSELICERLDAAVAKAAGLEFYTEEHPTDPPRPFACWVRAGDDLVMFRPSMDWSDGGPFFEREQIIWRHHDDGRIEACVMRGVIGVNRRRVGKQFGATLLQAGMRAFVASKFGEEVDL